MTAIFYRK